MKDLIRFMLIFFVLISFIFGCSNKKQALPEERPKSFEFILNYGIGGKNQLDTIKSTYTKDMVREPSITTNLKLSDSEMDNIYSMMKDINILSYPDKFQPKGNGFASPHSTYSIKIFIDGKEKDINWAEDNLSESKDAVKLRNLIRSIHKIISEKEEYKVLPEPKNEYM